jgi:Multiubiquitin
MEQREQEQTHHARIHIDQQRYESPNPTSADALYQLANVPPGIRLYREVNGNREDEPIEDGTETIHLRQDEHFHSGQAKTYTLYVNGQTKTVTNKRETYDQIAALAYPTPPAPDTTFTVTYDNGPHQNPHGLLEQGQTVKVKNGMVFNVTPTIRS